MTPDFETKRDRCLGAMIGLAIGDALGTTNEFASGDSITVIDDIVGGGPFNLEPGQWTDDTSMALCLANSLSNKDFDMKDQLYSYHNWYEHGFMSSTGTCFDIGAQTQNSLSDFINNKTILSRRTHFSNSGNGGIMRLAPVVIKYNDDVFNCSFAAEMQSATTHSSVICREAAALMAEIMFNAINRLDSETKQSILKVSRARAYITPQIFEINTGTFKNKEFREVFSENGFVASSLEFALWCFYNTDSFSDCVLMAANSGGDADTNAAIAGQIAGSFYGFSDIPEEWVSKLYGVQTLTKLTDSLMENNNDNL